MLRQLQPGGWTVRFRDGTPEKRLCLRTGLELLAVRPVRADCRRTVVDDGANEVAVQLACPPDGFSRVSVRRESDSLVQLQIQGVHRNAPFSLAAEARRTGSCR